MSFCPGDYGSSLHHSCFVTSALVAISSMPLYVSMVILSSCCTGTVDPIGRKEIYFVSNNIFACLGLSAY